jgi:hypothetical protein
MQNVKIIEHRPFFFRFFSKIYNNWCISWRFLTLASKQNVYSPHFCSIFAFNLCQKSHVSPSSCMFWTCAKTFLRNCQSTLWHLDKQFHKVQHSRAKLCNVNNLAPVFHNYIRVISKESSAMTFAWSVCLSDWFLWMPSRAQIPPKHTILWFEFHFWPLKWAI